MVAYGRWSLTRSGRYERVGTIFVAKINYLNQTLRLHLLHNFLNLLIIYEIIKYCDPGPGGSKAD